MSGTLVLASCPKPKRVGVEDGEKDIKVKIYIGIRKSRGEEGRIRRGKNA
jgi:hypothetical protein